MQKSFIEMTRKIKMSSALCCMCRNERPIRIERRQFHFEFNLQSNDLSIFLSFFF